MSDRVFLDTNILVYCFDQSSPQKQIQARAIVETNLAHHRAIISYQVVQEFLSVATRKFHAQFITEDCEEYLMAVLKPLCTIFPSFELYAAALQLHQQTQYSYYDSLLITSAASANCKTLYTEDMQHGQQIHGLTIQNPFL